VPLRKTVIMAPQGGWRRPGVVVRGGATEGVLGLEDRVRDQLARVLVGEGVEHAGAVLSGGDHTGQAQLGEMLGDGGG
jgi:hypothetical protein